MKHYDDYDDYDKPKFEKIKKKKKDYHDTNIKVKRDKKNCHTQKELLKEELNKLEDSVNELFRKIDL